MIHKLLGLLHYLLIPHERNNYRAKTLHIDALTFLLIFAFLFSISFRLLSGKTGEVLGFATDITVEKLMQKTNEARAGNGLSPLSGNDKLNAAAAAKAKDMFAQNYWSHYGPDGATPWDFILSHGYQYEYAGENLAKNFLFSDGVVDAWMNSSTHRENILRKDYTEVGYAVANGVLNGEETTLVVQLFGKPMGGAIPRTNVQAQEIVPTPVAATPVPTAVPEKNNSVILAKSAPSRSIFLVNIPLTSNIVFIGFFILALGLDFYFASKLHMMRIAGKNLAHMIFAGFILAGILFLTRGAIL